MLQLGYTVAGEWNSENSSFSTGNWWIFTTLGTLLVGFLVYRGIRTSAKTGVILGAIEISVFVLFGLYLIVKAGGNNDLAVFSTKYANAEGFTGWSGVIAGSVFCLLAFAGFEAAAPLAEETENPKKNIPKAVMIATVSIGALYALTTYAAAITFGPDKFKDFAGYNNGVPWDGLAKGVGTIFWLLVLFAIINSTIANANGGANVFTRTAYAFGRAGVFPAKLAELHPKYKSPRNAVVVQLVVGLALALGLGAKYTPQTAFGIVATGLVVAIVPVYMIANLACVGYFTKHRKEERHPLLHILVPIIGFLFLIPGFFNAAGITGVPGLKFIVALSSPLTLGAYAMGVWILLGFVALAYLSKNKPEAIKAVATVHE
jgi:amino acid transporter